MAEVEISYKGSNIATMNASGTKTLLTEAKYLEDDVTVTYTRPAAPSGTKNIVINQNGTTTEDVTNYASAQIAANVPNTYSAGDEGKVVSNGALVAQTSDTVTANDTYDTTLINSLTVNVSGGSDVPAAYDEYVFLSTAGNARFEFTDITPSVDDEIYCAVQVAKPLLSGNSSAILSAGSTGNRITVYWQYGSTTNDRRILIRNFTDSTYSAVGKEDNLLHIYSLIGSNVYQDNTSIATLARLGVPNSHLNFGGYPDGTQQLVGLLGFLRIERNDSVIHDIRPVVRKSDNTPGMYDIITGTFYTKTGTGTLTPMLPVSNSPALSVLLGGA